MNDRYPFVNEPLPYAYNALEPYIDEKTMHLHHDRHLQTYIDNLNTVLKLHPELQKYTLNQLLLNWDKLPEPLQIPVRNYAGGVYNHRFYFDGLAPDKITSENPMKKEIEEQFQDFDTFKSVMKGAALSVFGSGYAWLVSDHGVLKILTTLNQDTPDIERLIPVLNLDVWEHAYYLKHYNERVSYIDDWFSVVNWDKAWERFRNEQG